MVVPNAWVSGRRTELGVNRVKPPISSVPPAVQGKGELTPHAGRVRGYTPLVAA